MDFLLHIFNLSWSSHFFPSIWKTFSVIPIHKMGEHLDSSAFFRPISLISCVSKLFECIILSRLLFFLESNFILSLCQAGFRPGRATLDQILYLSQSISNGFSKPRPGSFCFVLFAIFILHSRESELYRYTLDGKSALAWELPFPRFMGHLSSTQRRGHPVKCLAQGHNKRTCRLVLHNLP